MLLLFIPIGIMVHLAEQLGKMQDNEAPLNEILVYLGNFSITIGSILLPIFLFLSVIFFTSKLASNTEIVAILSSGISYNRFLRPYLIGASLVAVFMFFMGMFIVPNASIGFNEFQFKYLKKGRQDRVTENIFNQLNERDFIYVSRFDPVRQIGYNFTMEHFDENNVMQYKLSAANIRWVPTDTLYRLTSYVKRSINGNKEMVETKRRLDTILVKYKRWTLPITAFILTLIAVAVSAQKRRGGMGVNLAFGILVAFIYIFFDRVFGTLAEQSGFSPLLAVIVPNLLFGMLAFYLLQQAKR